MILMIDIFSCKYAHCIDWAQLGNDSFAGVIDTAAWCNTWQAWFDVHDRYTTPAVISQPLDDVTNISSLPDWITPAHLVCLEFGPELDKRGVFWTQQIQDLHQKFLEANGQCDVANGYWNDSLITPWRNAQFGTTFSESDALNSLYLYDFTVACYGTTLQTASHEPQFDLSALRAQNVCSVNFHANELPEQFSIVKDEYTGSAVPYHVNGFNPHPDDCVGCGN